MSVKMQKMSRTRWNQLKARAEAGDSEAQWEVGSWLADGLADPSGFVFVHPNVRAAVFWFPGAQMPETLPARFISVAASTPGVAYVATTRKLFVGSSVRNFKVIPSPRAISRTFTRIGGTIAVPCSGINVPPPPATGTH